MDKDLALLHKKVDTLMGYMEAQQKRTQALQELQEDVIPIANHMTKLAIDELAEIGTEFRSEDLLFLVKRVLRNTPLLIRLMDQLEALMGIGEEVEILGQQVFSKTVEQLDEYERKGYFNFATEGMKIMDRIVTEFDTEDVQALGDNIVTILTTVRNMTQPDIMSFANNAVDALRDAPVPDKGPSPFQIMKELNDPKVRVGMARMLNLLKTLADQPNGSAVKN